MQLWTQIRQIPSWRPRLLAPAGVAAGVQAYSRGPGQLLVLCKPDLCWGSKTWVASHIPNGCCLSHGCAGRKGRWATRSGQALLQLHRDPHSHPSSHYSHIPLIHSLNTNQMPTICPEQGRPSTVRTNTGIPGDGGENVSGSKNTY